MHVDVHVLSYFKIFLNPEFLNTFRGVCYIAFVYFDEIGKKYTVIDELNGGVVVGSKMIEI